MRPSLFCVIMFVLLLFVCFAIVYFGEVGVVVGSRRLVDSCMYVGSIKSNSILLYFIFCL